MSDDALDLLALKQLAASGDKIYVTRLLEVAGNLIGMGVADQRGGL